MDVTSDMGDFGALGGVVLGAVLVWIGEFVKTYYARSVSSHYLAVRLIPLLEVLLDSSYDCAFDDGTALGQTDKNGCFQIQTLAPKFDLPDDVDWKSLDKKLLEAIMSISSQLYSISRNVSAEHEHAIPPYDDFMCYRQYEYAKFALDCDEVLTKVRALIKLPPLLYPRHSDPRERCRKFIEKYTKNNEM